MIPHRKNMALVGASAALIALVGSIPASADEKSGWSTPEVAHISGDELMNAQDSSVDGRASNASGRLESFLDEQAKLGNLLDASEVESASIKNPLDGRKIDIVWSDALRPTEMNLSSREGPKENVAAGMGIAVSNNPEVEQDKAPASTATGAGYGSGTPNGMYLQANDCLTAYYEPQFESEDDHHMVTCYEKFAESGTREWVYNRWSLWTTAQIGDGGIDGKAVPIDYTIRSRPWRGTSGRISKMNDFAPRSPETNCSPGASFTLGYAGSGVTIPMENCEGVKTLPDTGAKSMGVDWDPGNNNAVQLGLDFGMQVTARDSEVVPTWADYVWAEVQSCGIICTPLDPSYSYVHTDSGW
ncbi:hypothetical protein NOGI109294_20230 [Nocardiopsis gilva]|nr:hypothetical protein [Nocardiopsis gilva]